MSDLVPDGIYGGIAVKSEYKKTAKSNDDYLEIICEITDEGKYKGRRLECNCWFNKKENAERAMKTLLFCGWDGDDVLELKGLGSKKVDLVIQIEEPQKKEDGTFYPAKNRVAFINEAGSTPTGRSMNDQEKNTFAARLLALKATMGISKSTTTETHAPAASAPPQNVPPQGKIPI